MTASDKLDLTQFHGHTEGPWEWDERIRTWGLYPKGKAPNCHGDNTNEICRITPDRMGEQDPTGFWPGSQRQHADKALLAASPVLLAKLREAVELLTDIVTPTNCRPPDATPVSEADIIAFLASIHTGDQTDD